METDVSQHLPTNPEDTGHLISVFSEAEILVLVLGFIITQLHTTHKS